MWSLVLLISIPFFVVYEAWAIICLWNWFLIGFIGQPINFGIAIGMSLLIGLLTHQVSGKSDKDPVEIWILELSRTTIFLLTGYIAHLFI